MLGGVPSGKVSHEHMELITVTERPGDTGREAREAACMRVMALLDGHPTIPEYGETCGARTRTGTPCQQPLGWVGHGSCWERAL